MGWATGSVLTVLMLPHSHAPLSPYLRKVTYRCMGREVLDAAPLRS